MCKPNRAFFRRWLPGLLLLASLVACVQAPVQEMSDARQAIRAAEVVIEQPRERADLDTAGVLLREAEAALKVGRYREAKRLASAARDQARAVRERAMEAK